MAEYASYYVELLWSLWENVKSFFGSIFYTIYKAIVLDIKGYFALLGERIGEFDVGGWIMLILVAFINFALIFFVLYRLFQIIRRYVLYRSKEVDKDKLMEEVARLKEEAANLVEEKKKILALKVGVDIRGSVKDDKEKSLLHGKSADKSGAPLSATTVSRFAKLSGLDEKYKHNSMHIFMDDKDMLTLPEIINRFINFAASQLKLYYTEDTIRKFFAGLATSKIIILEGISGTGKTSLPYAMAKFFNNGASIISVQPSWRDRAELLGYFNEFTKKFNETDFLAGLYEATLRDDPNFIVLDEMNLARIEYYFADFLSVMEMPDIAEWKIDIVSDSAVGDPKNVVYGKILVPQNLWFVGTANNDDSTFSITDKVYDRAISLELNQKADYIDAPITESIVCSYEYLDSLFEAAIKDIKISEKNAVLLSELDDYIQKKFKIAFGNRVAKQLKTFIPVYVACGGAEIDGLDYIVASKILRKFNSLNLPFLTKELDELIAFMGRKFGKNAFKYSIDYIRELQKQG